MTNLCSYLFTVLNKQGICVTLLASDFDVCDDVAQLVTDPNISFLRGVSCHLVTLDIFLFESELLLLETSLGISLCLLILLEQLSPIANHYSSTNLYF